MKAPGILILVLPFGFVASLLIPSTSRAGDAGPGGPMVGVRLETPRETYVLGQLVPLLIEVTNLTRRPILGTKASDGRSGREPELHLLIAGEGEAYRRAWFGPAIECGPREEETLEPRKSWDYTLDVLHVALTEGRDVTGGLAFPRPGAYSIKVVCPLHFRGITGPTEMETNVIRIRVEEPKGKDLEVWRRIRGREFLSLMQLRSRSQALEGTVLELAGVLRDLPGTAYQRQIEETLYQIYNERSVRLSDEARKRVGVAIGYVDP